MTLEEIIKEARRTKSTVDDACSTSSKVPKLTREAILQATEDLMDLITRVAAAAEAAEAKVDLLKDQLKEARKTPVLTYAGAATTAQSRSGNGPPRQNMGKTTAESTTVFLKPKSPTKIEELKTKFTASCNPAQEKIKIKSLRSTKGGLLVVECHHESDRKKIEASAKLADKFQVEKPKKRKPMLILYEVDSTLREDDLKKAIMEQNLDGKIKGEDLELRFRTGPRNKPTTNWVIEVSPELRQNILNQGRVYVGYTGLKAKDFLQVARCAKCKDLGHVQKHCPGEERCGHCGGKDHGKESCPDKQKPARCIPCSNKGKKCTKPNTKECPSHGMALKRLQDRTDYG